MMSRERQNERGAELVFGLPFLFGRSTGSSSHQKRGGSLIFKLILIAVVISSALIPSSAQIESGEPGRSTPTWLFPDGPLLPFLLAAPREPVTRAHLVHADPNPTAYGPGPAGEVAVSVTAPVILLGGGDQTAVVVGIEGAAFARFSFAVITRELVNTDWIFAVPLVWRRGGDWLRLRYYHTSSHLGDEYQGRFGPSSINYSRDGLELTAFARPGIEGLRRWRLGLYAGGLWSVNSHPEGGSVWRARAGFEIDPSRGMLWQPYGGLDAEFEEGSDHGVRIVTQIGIWLPPVQGRPLRLALEIIDGPSVMGQFTRRATRRVALGLLWNP
jgi:hypothetical protein